MAGDHNSVCFPGGAAFPPPAPQPLHHCHSAASLYSSLPITGGGPTFLPPGGAALSALQHELLSEAAYDLPENSGAGRDSYSLEWGPPSYSASAPFNGFPASSGVGSSMMATDVAGFSPLMGGAVQCDSTVDPLCSTIGSSMLPLEGEVFSPFVEGAIPCDSTAGQFNGPLLSSSNGGAASFCPSGYQETLPYSSAASFTESPAICSNELTALQFDAASFHQSSEKGIFCYSSSTAPINKPPAISSNGQMVPHMAPAAEAGPSQAEPSERNDLDLSIIWSAEEQHQLNEQLKRYGHIESTVARLAKIARPFAGKSIRDVALRIKWMEEKSSQRANVVNSSRSQRAVLRAPGKSRDYSSQPSSRPGIPY